MAAKKTETKPEEEIRAEEAAAAQETAAPAEAVAPAAPEMPEAPETQKSAWDEMVEIIVPRKPKGEDQQYYVCVNDRRFTIPADGTIQKLPRPVAEVLKMSIDAENAAEKFADQIKVDMQPAMTM